VKWEWIKQDERYRVSRPAIEKMMQGAAEICAELAKIVPEYKPFHDNENAGVSILLAGSARKGLYPVSEYPIEKLSWDSIKKKNTGKTLTTRDLRNTISGRADLWLHDGEKAFSFEFKKSSERENRHLGPKGTESDICYRLDLAVDEIGRIDNSEYHRAIGGLICPIYEGTQNDSKSILEEMCTRPPFSGKISGENYQVYFLFSEKKISMPE